MTNREHVLDGRAVFTAYVKRRKLSMIERKQDYSITDCIVELLHFARSKGFDTDSLMESAGNHLDAETIESCPKCGRWVTRENSFQDDGEGDEDGRTFYYCSEHCRTTH